MVRTYAFNPSTQTTATEMLEAFNKEGFRRAKKVPIHFKSEFNGYQFDNSGYLPDWPPTLSHQNANFVNRQRQNQPSNLIKGRALGNSMASVQSLTASSSASATSSHASLTRSKSQRLPPTKPLVMEEERTTVLGIRSVLINGQRFYQPVDLDANGGTRNRSHKFAHPSDPMPPNDHVPKSNSNVRVLATAIQMLNGHQSNTNANFDDDFLPSPPRQQQKHATFQPANGQHPMDNGNFSHGQQSFSETKLQPPPPVFHQAGQTSSATDHQQRKRREEDQVGSTDSPLPWAKGNPQPKSGKRGSDSWNLGQSIGHGHQININGFAGGHHQNLLPTIAETNGNGFARFGDSGTHSLGSTYTLPFAFNNTRPQFTSNSPSINTNTHSDPAFWTERAEKERHKMELLRQIEENQHRKLMEKQREWEQEERERIMNEKYQQRMREELEEERRKEREKALAAERKAAQIAAAQRATEQAIREAQAQKSRIRNGGPHAHNVPSRSGGRRTSSLGRGSDDDDGQSQRLEWWERKDLQKQEEEARRRRNADGPSSPVIPALRSQQEEDIQGKNTSAANERSKSLSRLNSLSSSSDHSLNRRREPSRDHSGRQSRYEPTMARVDERTRPDSLRRSPSSPSQNLDAIRSRMSVRNQQIEQLEQRDRNDH